MAAKQWTGEDLGGIHLDLMKVISRHFPGGSEEDLGETQHGKRRPGQKLTTRKCKTVPAAPTCLTVLHKSCSISLRTPRRSALLDKVTVTHPMFSNQRLGLQVSSPPFMVHKYLCHMRATCPAELVLSDWTILILYDEKCTSWNSPTG
jgi:hypothetical protein